MAEIFLNPAINSIRGRVGDLVFYTSRGKNFARSYVVPRNPGTHAQSRNRGLFRDAMKAWQGLSSIIKDEFSRRARQLGMTGHNLFISCYLTAARNENKAIHNTASPDFTLSSGFALSRQPHPALKVALSNNSPSLQPLIHSVSDSIPLKNRHISASMPDFHPRGS